MTNWQRRARLVIAVAGVAFAIGVGFALKRRAPQPVVPPATRADPAAVLEVTGGRIERFKFSREDVRVAYERQLTYADGSTRLMGVTISVDQRAGGRGFTVTGQEAKVGQNESTILLNGNVQLTASDGMAVRTEQASYSDTDALVRATGPVEYSQGRMSGSSIGMTFDIARDVLVLSDRAIVHVLPDGQGGDAFEIASGTATFARREKNVRFERDVRLQRASQAIEADMAVAHLTADESQIDRLDLHGRSRIAMDKVAPGGLRELSGRDIDLEYGADGRSLEHATLVGDAAIVLAAGPGDKVGRQIRANTIEVALASDGATPASVTAASSVVLTLPAEGTLPERTIRSDTMDATSTPGSPGEPARGLTSARFNGNVEFQEVGSNVDRVAKAAALDVMLEPAMAGIREARFANGVQFVDGGMTGRSAVARYDSVSGTLELSGSEPGALRPRVVNGQMAVDATQIDVALAGPDLKAAGAVKSVIAKGRGGAGGSKPDTQLPSMFKSDKPVNVTADGLDYRATGKATYTGNAQLWQEETSIKGPSIVLDQKSGDLTASGGVNTVTVRESVGGIKKAERARSVASASDFRYEETGRRATYTGKVHMNSPEGDMTAARIELYLLSSGGDDDLERVEAYDDVTLRDQNRTITGGRLTYTAADQRYVVTGTPVKLLDECRRETSGTTLTYVKSAGTVTIDGNEQARTQSKGTGQCP